MNRRVFIHQTGLFAAAAVGSPLLAAGKEPAFRLSLAVADSGYRGYVEVEFSGEQIPEAEGIKRSKQFLEKVRDEF